MDLTESGYDCDFVDDVSEELNCFVFHLLLREPVQLEHRGHRLSKSCFNQISSHAHDSYRNSCFFLCHSKENFSNYTRK